MKKIFFVCAFTLGMPFVVLAAGFERDLFFGVSGDGDVTRLQQFLTSQGVYAGPVTGNFFSLTREGIKRFQEREGISPALGYFGPKTRARANEILAKLGGESSGRASELESLIASLDAVRLLFPSPAIDSLIASYRQELSSLKPNVETPSPAPSPAPAPEPSVTSTPPAETKKEELRVSGGSTQTFPYAAVTPMKIGDFTVKNDLPATVYFDQISLKLSDQMNSPRNRARKVTFVLREGATSADTVLKTETFTFHSVAPATDSPHVSIFQIPFPVTLAAGAGKTFSLWVDDFDYVISGSLAIEFYSLFASTEVSPVGGFTFRFERP